MASSDDEGENVPRNVSDYEFISGLNEPISFGELPVEWNKGGTFDEKLQEIFLRGTTDDGLQKLYKEVVAWKFNLTCKKPEISVLSIEGHWIKLLKPRKAFEVIIRTILITMHFLHLIKSNPELSHKTLWDNLSKTFSVFDTRPSEEDLIDHISLIQEAVKRDETLAKSKLLSTFLEEKPRKRKTFIEDTKPCFIVEDVSEVEHVKFAKSDKSDDESEEEDDCFDSVCAICDNGGHIYLCEGKCMRSFHATEEDGEESNCDSLGFTEEEVEALRNADFYCKNCKYKQHQCFSCGELGSSDESSGAEVFRCVNGACGRFYHPGCVAKHLHHGDKAAAEEHCQKIAAGEQFACPVHKCYVCKELEVRSVHELQFAICRRCPRAYHRKCLPRAIAFEKDVDEGRATMQRAWENLIPNRVLIYCLKHEIEENLFTPVRDHIRFPGPQRITRVLPIKSINKDLSRNRSFILEDTSGNRSFLKPSKGVAKLSSDSKLGGVYRKRVEKLPAQEFIKKKKVTINRNSLGNSNKSTAVESKISLGDRLYAAYGLDSEPSEPSREERFCGEHEKTQNIMPTAKRINNAVTLDDDARERILTLMKDASSSVTLEDIKRRHKTPSTHSQFSRFSVENVTLGKVEGSVKALRTALEKLNKGGSVEDAKVFCGNDLLVQVMKWKEKLKVYLAPFLYGMRYTSFGRHFTNTEKLKGIVDMLHWYMQDGDMLVDFCCGSNDFSCFMKKKLDEVGKKCSFKNYDILQAKNDFCFERKDWMGVQRNELPEGSRLIMGLNPPFGVNAALANKFINKALEFKPKLIILIVPSETQRLDEKKSRYDLIWEDTQMLAGKSFYLPGSIDINDKQIEGWNVNPPPLYLWSSPDWTPKHKAIAEQHRHPRSQKNYKMEECPPQVVQVPTQPQECHNLDESLNQVEDKRSDVRKKNDRKRKESMPRETEGDNNREQSSNNSQAKLKSSGKKRKKKRKIGSMKETALKDKSSIENVIMEKSSNKNVIEDKFSNKKVIVNDKSYSKLSGSLHPSPNVPDVTSLEAYSSKHLEKQSHVHAGREYSRSLYSSANMDDGGSSRSREIQSHGHSGRENLDQFDLSSSATYHSYNQTEYNVNQVDDLLTKYRLTGEESFPSMASIYAPSPNPDYSFRSSTERYMGYPEERMSVVPYNRSYPSEMNHSTPQSHLSFLGREEPNAWSQRNKYMSYPGPGFLSSYGQLNSAANSSYGGMTSSAMSRYVPRLDDVNHGGINPVVSGPPGLDIGGTYHTPPVPRPGSQVGSLGFATGPYRPYSQHNSSGWLNE